MLLCKSCRLRQELLCAFRIVAPHYRYSSTEVQGKIARSNGLVILDTPKSTREPKKTTKQSKPSISPAMQASMLTKFAKHNDMNRETYAQLIEKDNQIANDEVFRFLEGMKLKYRDRELTPIKYKNVADTLRLSFSARQLKAYLAYCKVSPQGQRGRLPQHVLERAWGTTERDFKGSTTSKVSKLSEEVLHFLLVENGKILQTLSVKHKLKLAINRSTRDLVMDGSSEKIRAVEDELRKFSSQINSKTIVVEVPMSWRPDDNIARKTNSFIQIGSPTQIRIFSLSALSSDPEHAEQLLLESLSLHSSSRLISRIAASDNARPVRELPVYVPKPPVAEQRYRWVREASQYPGITLPSYHIYSKDPRPLKSSQVMAKPHFKSLQNDMASEEGKDLVSLLRIPAGSDNIEVTFGYCLSAMNVPAYTFSSNIPGQFHVLKDYDLRYKDEKDYKLFLTNPLNSETITLSTNALLESPASEDFQHEATKYHHSRTFQLQNYLKCPSQPSDLAIRHVTNYTLSSTNNLQEFLAKCDFRNANVPTTIDLDAQVWHVQWALVTTLTFGIKTLQSSGLSLEWSKLRFPTTDGEKSQELKIVGNSGIETKQIVEAVTQVFKDMRRL